MNRDDDGDDGGLNRKEVVVLGEDGDKCDEELPTPPNV